MRYGILAALFGGVVGCGGEPAPAPATPAPGDAPTEAQEAAEVPTFSLAWSEYRAGLPSV